MTVPFWVLQVVLVLALLLVFLALGLCVAAARKPRMPRRAIHVTDDLIRQCRFYDDQYDPVRELYGRRTDLSATRGTEESD